MCIDGAVNIPHEQFRHDSGSVRGGNTIVESCLGPISSIILVALRLIGSLYFGEEISSEHLFCFLLGRLGVILFARLVTLQGLLGQTPGAPWASPGPNP